MGKIVLLAVAAAWAAVLLPPLLRSRLENRPGSSVTDFRRQLSRLQRTVPTRSMTPMRSMARPLASSPLQRPAVTRRRRPDAAAHRTLPTPRRSTTPANCSAHPREPGTRRTRPAAGRCAISQRELIRRRRANVLFVLVAANVPDAVPGRDHQVVGHGLRLRPVVRVAVRLLLQAGPDPPVRPGPPYSDANWFHAA